MMRARLGAWIAYAAGLVLAATPTQAVSDAEKCEAAKNKVAGMYAFCRQKAEAKAIKTGAPVDYTKCDTSYGTRWMSAETNGGGMCPTNGDQSAMQALITQHADDVATALDGGGLPACGDDAINVAGEQCDGTDLGGETCVTLGFAGGSLACASCLLDTSACTCGDGGGAFPATGQTTAYGTGSDGDVEAGNTLSYTDNGDGTITDNVTGLMWEKKDDSGGIHDQDNLYTWCVDVSPDNGACDNGTNSMDGTIVTTFLAALNGGGGFAGYTDWRIPNYKELTSILDLETVGPAVDPAFHQSATCTGCTDVTAAACSCMQSNYYWSSTTYQGEMEGAASSAPPAPGPNVAWSVEFNGGFVIAIFDKISVLYVRAVRGGL